MELWLRGWEHLHAATEERLGATERMHVPIINLGDYKQPGKGGGCSTVGYEAASPELLAGMRLNDNLQHNFFPLE